MLNVFLNIYKYLHMYICICEVLTTFMKYVKSVNVVNVHI